MARQGFSAPCCPVLADMGRGIKNIRRAAFLKGIDFNTEPDDAEEWRNAGVFQFETPVP
jgi:hypothetical protein